MEEVVALIPAKSTSERVPDKNFRPFHEGLCLVEWKIRQLQAAGIQHIIVSSNDVRARRIAKDFGARFQDRPHELCSNFIDLRALFAFCLRDVVDRLVYWAHPTSPFVRAASIRSAAESAKGLDQGCVVGVQRLQEFLWSADGPINYDPHCQPRSQDLEPLFRVTGGIHMAFGKQFIAQGAVTFPPATFVELDAVESIDINSEEEWLLATQLAATVLDVI
jgi:CMP-N-acetylneuraminic acid synthetase